MMGSKLFVVYHTFQIFQQTHGIISVLLSRYVVTDSLTIDRLNYLNRVHLKSIIALAPS